MKEWSLEKMIFKKAKNLLIIRGKIQNFEENLEKMLELMNEYNRYRKNGEYIVIFPSFPIERDGHSP